MIRNFRLTGALACALVSGFSIQAQDWVRVVSAAGQGSAIGAGSGNTLYAGLRAGDVFRSDDNGRTWTSVNTGLVDSFGGKLGVHAFALAGNGRVIRGGPNASWNNTIGSPIFYTDNQGAQWIQSPLPFLTPAVNPAGISVSDMVAHQGAVYFSDVLSGGVWKSEDNGQTWTAVGMSLPVVSPFGPPTRTYNAIASSGNALLTVEGLRGVWRSTDGGATWAQSVSGIPGVVNSPLVGGRSWSGLDVTGSADGTAFAVVDNMLYRSRDAGATWEQVGNGLFNPRKVEFAGGKVYVATFGAVPSFYESSDLGATWIQLPSPASGGLVLEALTQSFYAHNGAIYFGGLDGIYRLDLATASRTNLLPAVTLAHSGQLLANVGGTLQLGTTVQGTGPFTYEWRLNDAAIAGQSGASLNWLLGNINQSGAVTLVVTGPGGSVTNNVGQLTVAPMGPGMPDYSYRPQNVTGGFLTPTVQAVAVDNDGTVFFGGANHWSIQGDTYRGVRHTFADGSIDLKFLTGVVGGNGTGPTQPVRTLLPMGDGSVIVGAGGTGNNDRYFFRLRADGSVDPDFQWPASMPGAMWKIVRLPDGKFLAGTGNTGGLYRLNSDGSVDESFALVEIGQYQRNFVRDFVILPDGSTIIAGNFAAVNGVTRHSLAKILPNGGLDASWVPASVGSGREVSAILRLPDGKLLIGGNFTTVTNQQRAYVARLNADGTLDATFPNLALNNTVTAMALQPDGKVWIGGSFTAPLGRSYVARLNTDGTLDASMPDIGLTSPPGVLQLAADGKLWIGSSTTQLGNYPAGHLVRVFTDLPAPTLAFGGLSQSPDSGTSIVLNGSASGPFTAAQWLFNGSPLPGANALALPLNNVTIANSGVYQLVLTSTGGASTSAPVNVRVRGAVVLDRSPEPAIGLISNSVSFVSSAFGKLPLSYQWTFNGTAVAGATNRSLTVSNLTLAKGGDYAVTVTGGDGSQTNSEPAFLTIMPIPGTRDTNFNVRLFNISQFSQASITDFLPLQDGKVLVSGAFLTKSNGTQTAMARLNPDGSVDESFVHDSLGISEIRQYQVQSSGKIVVAVRLSQGGGPYVVRRFNADGSQDTTFTNTAISYPNGLIVGADDSIYVAHQRLSRLNPNGGLDAAFEARATFNGSGLQSLARDAEGRFYVAGSFTQVSGKPRQYLARILADGSLDESFDPQGIVQLPQKVLAVPDGVLYQQFDRIIRFTETGAINSSWNFEMRGGNMEVLPDGSVAVITASNPPQGLILDSNARPAKPSGTFVLPQGLYFSQFRALPDGSFMISQGQFANPTNLLVRASGIVMPLVLLNQPAGLTANAGETVTLRSAATGTSAVSYQWQKNGANLPGETNPTLTISNAQMTASGNYQVVVRNRSGSATSRTAAVVVLGTPEVLSLSSNLSAGILDRFTLQVSARGVAPLTYQWRKDGQPIAGATSASYTNNSATLADAGRYDVQIQNGLGTTTSAGITVSVVAVPGAVIRSFDPTYGNGVIELAILPDGRILVGGMVGGLQAFNLFGQTDTNFTVLAGTTDWREKIAIDPVLGRIYGAPSTVRAIDFSGKPVPSFVSPPVNTRLVRVEAGGSLLTLDQSISAVLRRIDTNGTVLGTLNVPVPSLVDILPTSDGKILALGSARRTVGFNFVYDTKVARLNADGSLDESFVVSTNIWQSVQSPAAGLMLDREGRVLVFGDFETYLQQPRSRIARLLPNGALDTAFVPPQIDGGIMDVAQQQDGKLVIVGSFTTVGGTNRNLVARLNADGSHDTGFDPGSGLTKTPAGSQNVAFDVEILANGSIVVGGTFDQAGGLPRPGLALLAGGEPGGSGVPTDPFADWATAAGLSGPDAAPGADPDRDGMPNRAEFVYGTSPTNADSRPLFRGGTYRSGAGQPFPSVSFVRRVGGSVRVQASRTISFEALVPVVQESVAPAGPGLEMVTVRSSEPQIGAGAQFFRLIAE